MTQAMTIGSLVTKVGIGPILSTVTQVTVAPRPMISITLSFETMLAFAD